MGVALKIAEYVPKTKWTIKKAQEITHTLSAPSKMPSFSTSLDAEHCKTGSKLRKVKGSVCYDCYACKGFYLMPNTKNAMAKRLTGITHPQWSEAMAFLISKKEKSGYFRWHDSGDVQDLQHLEKIIDVCERLPDIKFWLPTHEAWVAKYFKRNPTPENLTMRFSMALVDQEANPKIYPTTSTVVSSKEKMTCLAPTQDGYCKDCRKCWDKNVSNVAYLQH